jgi:hypothetical protein
MAITLLEECRDYRLGSKGSVLVTVWFSELTTAALDALEKHHEALANRLGKITLVSIIVSATEAPRAELRERLRAQSTQLAKRRLGNIIVVRAKGLSAIIARSFLAALSLVSTETIKVPATLEAAANEVRALAGQNADVVNDATLGGELEAFAELPRPA